jgi:hypothetical protein
MADGWGGLPPPPFYQRPAAGAHGLGSELDHPGAHLYVPLPPDSWVSDAASQHQQHVAAPVHQQPAVTPHVVLPPFKPARPASWFAMCANVFRMRGVTDQRDMFTLCYNMLGDEQQAQVDDLAEQLPLPPDAFFRMQDRLVASHSLDAYQRLEQLMALPALGGQRPSALLAQMRQLCPPGEDGTLLFRYCFVQRLPQQIQLQLAEDRHSPVQALAARANTLMVHHSYDAFAAVEMHSVGEEEEVVAAVRDPKKPARKQQHQQGRRRAAAPGSKSGGGGPKKEPWLCLHHHQYGKQASSARTPTPVAGRKTSPPGAAAAVPTAAG